MRSSKKLTIQTQLESQQLRGLLTLSWAPSRSVAAVFATLEASVSPELDIAAVKLASAIFPLLPSTKAAQLLRLHGFVFGASAARAAQDGAGGGQSPASDEGGAPEGRKRARTDKAATD